MLRSPLALLVALVVGIAGCSGSPSSDDETPPALPQVEVVAPDVVVDAVRALQDEESVRFEFAHIDETQVGPTSITGDGVASLDGRRAEAEFTLTLLGQENVGVARIVDGVRYVMSGGTGRWQRSPSRDEPGLTDVAARIEQLLALDVELTEEGTEDVAGTSTTKYVWTAEDRTEGDRSITQAGGSFWVDGEGRLRQFDSRRVVEERGVTRIVGDIVTIPELGVAVDVEAPPTDLVDDPTTDATDAPLL